MLDLFVPLLVMLPFTVPLGWSPVARISEPATLFTVVPDPPEISTALDSPLITPVEVAEPIVEILTRVTLPPLSPANHDVE